MLQAILNNSRKQHTTNQQLYGHLPPNSKSIQLRRTRDAGHSWKNKDELFYEHMDVSVLADQQELIYISSALT